jgi:LacI family transcriptional regulator
MRAAWWSRSMRRSTGRGRERTYLELIARNHVDGLIFVTNHPDEGELARLINRTGKVVVVDEDVPDAIAPKLFCDNFEGGRLAGLHLAEQGHRRVLFIGGREEMISARRRYEGLAAGLREADGSIDEPLRATPANYTIDYGREAARQFIADGQPATAIFASSDEIAIGLMEIFAAAGVSIPTDVSVIGFDNVGPLHLFNPPLTAIEQPVRALGRRARSKFFWKPIGRTKSPLAARNSCPIKIVRRQSVAPPAKR